MADLQVSVAATRFVDAVAALRLARRCWHRLDAALVEMPHKKKTAQWEAAWEAIRVLDHAIADATDDLLQVANDPAADR